MPLLDTAFVLDFLEGEPAAVRTMELLEQGTRPLGVTPHTHFELYVGVGRSTRPDEERQRVEGFLSELDLFPFEPEVARTAGLMHTRLEREGNPVGLVDLFIACAALHRGEPVVTRNVGEFERVPGLEVLGY